MFPTKDVPIVPCRRRPAPFVELRQILPARVAISSPFAVQMMRFINHVSPEAIDRETAAGIEAALRETLANAIVQHNHQGSDEFVRVACRCSLDGEVFISIGDGEEPAVARLLRPATSADHPGSIQGRGVQATKH